jgi:Flp pilus assembly protein TadG
MRPPAAAARVAARLGRVARALAHDRDGAVAIEMALLAPVLFLMYCGCYVVSDMVTCGRKVSLTAHSLADLTSQYASASTATVTASMSNAAYVLAPYNSSTVSLRVNELQIVDASHATVVWSVGQNCTAMAAGTSVTLPTNMAPALMQPNSSNNNVGAYIIMSEASYPYTPLFGAGWLPSPNLYNRYFMLPRVSTTIPLTS